MNRMIAVLIVAAAAGVGAGAATAPSAGNLPADAVFVRQVPWYEHGVWMKVDTHIHTLYSDGGKTPTEVASRALANGCDAIAITDHADRNLKAATPEYFAAIERARSDYPRLIVLAGLEWNVPPQNGRAHATVVALPEVERRLAMFKEAFDDLGRSSRGDQLALDGLRWLAEFLTVDGIPPVVTYEHPSRGAARTADLARDLRVWRSVNDLFIGFAGAPGHQGTKPIGSYEGRLKTVDRWDPVAVPGDAWDTLLGEGQDVWGAYAVSDFHTDNLAALADYPPGAFAETWAYVPDRSAKGLLRALRAGTFFADHGRIVRDVDLRVSAPGLTRPAHAGEVISVPAESAITVQLSFTVPAQAWRPGPNRIEMVELIGIDRNGGRVVWGGDPDPDGPAFSRSLIVPAEGIVLRARGFHVLETGTRLAFYTNPVRVITSSH